LLTGAMCCSPQGFQSMRSVQIIVRGEKDRDDMVRFARNAGFRAESVGRQGEEFLLEIQKQKPEEMEELEEVAVEEGPRDSVLLIRSEEIGTGDGPLGRMLMKQFLYSLTEMEQRPTAIVMVSSGVRLATRKSESLDALRALEKAHVEVMVCRASVEFLKSTADVAVGMLCDMYQIVERLLAADIVLSI